MLSGLTGCAIPPKSPVEKTTRRGAMPASTLPSAGRGLFTGSRGVAAFVVLVVLAPLTGCMVGPDFNKPIAPVAERFLKQGGPVLAASADYRSWWTVFHDPVLNRLIELAYAQNLPLQVAGTRVIEARAALGIAIGEFYPQSQQALGSLTYAGQSREDPFSNPFAPRYFWRDNLAAAIGWELDFWGKFRRGVEAADAAYLASIATYDDVLVTLLGDVAATYIGIRTTQRQIEIARDNIVKQRKALEIAEARFRGGVTSKLAVYQAQNVLGQTESAIPQLEIQLDQGLNALRLLLGMPPQSLDRLLAGSHGIPVPPAEVVVGIPADLVRRRPDIRAAELRAAAQSAQIGIAEADLFPAFSLTGSFGGAASTVRGATLGDVFIGKGITFAFGPSFSWNILNYGQITNNVRVQDAKLQALLIEYQNTVLKAQKEVEDGLTKFYNSQKQVVYLRQSVAAARAALNIALIEFNLGTRDFTTVLTAEQNLYTAENDLAIAEGNVSAGLTAVFRALGGGWQLREGNDFVPPAIREEMRQRTDYGSVLPPLGEPQPPPPLLPSSEDIGPLVRPPQW
jgi:NodT family efflux transporter outer membrane factor (OMF) lipoprotein